MIPTFLKTGDLPEPQLPLYYLLAANGLFMVRKTELFTSVSRVFRPQGLGWQDPALALAFGKVPRAVMEQVYGFFDWAWRRWCSEAIVFLYYSPSAGVFRVDAPPQTIYLCRRLGAWRAEGRVAYRSMPRPDGFLKLGDLHSHGAHPAFFSMQDDRDDCEEGLKIVMGHIDRRRPETEVSFVAGRHRFPLRSSETFEQFAVPLEPPREWIERFSCEYERDEENC